MKFPFFSNFQSKVGIDIGTTRVRIWTKKGFVIDEPTCIAFDERAKKVLAVGQEAYEMIGRVSKNISITFPFRAGVIVDEDATAALLKVFFQRLFPSLAFVQPIVGVSVSSEATQAERDALVRALSTIGAHEVYVIDQTLSAAIGAGVPIADASGSFILHMGGGVTEGGIIALGSLVEVRAVPQAGQLLDEAIAARVLKTKQLIISHKRAEQIKKEIGSVVEYTDEDQGRSQGRSSGKELLISGRDKETGVPREVYIDANLTRDLIQATCTRYVDLMKEVFSKIPPELTSDVLDKGILCTGGLAHLHGVETFFTAKLGVPMFVVDEPEKVVIKGIAQILEHIELFKQSLAYQG